MTDRTHPDSGRIITSGAADLPEALHRVIDDFERRERGIPQAHIAAALVTELRAALAAGQATAAQPVAREQLTPERVKEIVRGAGYDQCGIPDTERAAFINGLRHGERAHGIKKGGQHGTDET